MQAGVRSRYRRDCGARACSERQLGNERAIQTPLAGRRREIGRPKMDRTRTTIDAGKFRQPRGEWLSCSKLLNQIDLQAKSRSGGMADAADSKSVGRKPVKVRLLSPAVLPFFPLEKL